MNATCKYTKGPWEVYCPPGDEQHPYILHDEGKHPAKVIAIVFDDDPHTRPANAALIAAAPELLAALEALFDNCEMIHRHWGDSSNAADADAAVAAARAAIAKAKGE